MYNSSSIAGHFVALPVIFLRLACEMKPDFANVMFLFVLCPYFRSKEKMSVVLYYGRKHKGKSDACGKLVGKLAGRPEVVRATMPNHILMFDDMGSRHVDSKFMKWFTSCRHIQVAIIRPEDDPIWQLWSWERQWIATQQLRKHIDYTFIWDCNTDQKESSF